MRLLTVIGARPQFIKAAVISRLLAEQTGIEETLVHTGQHYDTAMSDVFFHELDLPQPDYALAVGSGSQAEQTGRMLIEIEKVLLAEQPDTVLVYGDTNSTLAGALAAAKLNIPVAHVEAGLRSYDRSMPEEINRCVTDHLARWHFCPTDRAVENLHREGIAANVHQVGDVMCDALFYYSQNDALSDRLARLVAETGPFALCTLHRAGNTDDAGRFARLWKGIERLSRELPVILPLHPRTRKVLAAAESERGQSGARTETAGTAETPRLWESESLDPAARSGRLHVIDPVGYRDMLALERRARLIVTDSGGVQKEAYLNGVPCLTLRDNTEWTETVEAGWNRLVGSCPDRLLAEARRFLEIGPPQQRPCFYGDGDAGARIVQTLLKTPALSG